MAAAVPGGGRHASHTFGSAQSFPQETGLCLSAGSTVTFACEAKGSGPTPAIWLLPKAEGGIAMQGGWRCTLAKGARKMGIRGAGVAPPHSPSFETQRSPVRDWQNCHPIAGTFKRRGKLGNTAFCPIISDSTLSSAFVRAARDVKTKHRATRQQVLTARARKQRAPVTQETPSATHVHTPVGRSFDKLFL